MAIVSKRPLRPGSYVPSDSVPRKEKPVGNWHEVEREICAKSEEIMVVRRIGHLDLVIDKVDYESVDGREEVPARKECHVSGSVENRWFENDPNDPRDDQNDPTLKSNEMVWVLYQRDDEKEAWNVGALALIASDRFNWRTPSLRLPGEGRYRLRAMAATEEARGVLTRGKPINEEEWEELVKERWITRDSRTITVIVGNPPAGNPPVSAVNPPESRWWYWAIGLGLFLLVAAGLIWRAYVNRNRQSRQPGGDSAETVRSPSNGNTNLLVLAAIAGIGAISALGFPAVDAQIAGSPAGTGEAQRKVTRVKIASIGEKKVNEQGRVVLDALDESVRLDVRIEGASVRDDDDVWLLIESENGRTYRGFFEPAKPKHEVSPERIPGQQSVPGRRPARQQPFVSQPPAGAQQGDRVTWTISGVELAEIGASQIKRFQLRAAVLPKAQKFEKNFMISDRTLEDLEKEKDIPDDVMRKLPVLKDKQVTGEDKFLSELNTAIGTDQAARFKELIKQYSLLSITIGSLERFITVSEPVTVEALKVIPRAGHLAIRAIGGQTVRPQSEAVVEPSMDVSGVRPHGSSDKVYLLLHPENSSEWRVWGPAETKGRDWYCRDVRFSEPSQPRSRYVHVSAFQTIEPLQQGLIPYSFYLEKVRAASPSVRVFVKDEKVPPSREMPEVTLTHYLTSDGNRKQIDVNLQILKPKDAEFLLQGTAKRMPQGKSLWALLNPLNTSLWMVQEGPASFSDDKWTLPRVRLEAPGDVPANKFRLLMVVADSALPVGIIDYATWQRQTAVVSPVLIVERESGGKRVQPSEVALSIVRVAGHAVGSDNKVEVASSGTVEVAAEGVPQDAQVWVCMNQTNGAGAWSVVSAFRKDETTWMTPSMVFGVDKKTEVPSGSDAPGEELKTLAAIVTRTSLPLAEGDFDWWRSYASTISPMVEVSHVTGFSLAKLFSSAAGTTLGIVALAALVLMGFLALRRAQSPSLSTTGEAMNMNDSSAAHPQDQAGAKPGHQTILMALGLLLLSLILFAASYYLGSAMLLALLALAALVALIMLASRFRSGSFAAAEVKKAADATLAYVQSQVRGIPKPHAVRSMLGLILLAVGLFAIIGYFPIYEHILHGALGLSGRQSHSLALLLIVFIGLTGVVADVTARYGHGREEDNEAGQSGRSSFGYYLLMGMLGLIALAMIIFQGILYLEFYQARAAEGSRIPFAFGAAALFITGIEMLNFYWATRLALDFIAWFFVHVFLLAPLSLLAKLAGIAQGEFNAPLDKAQKERIAPEHSAGQSQDAVSEEEASRIANVYILEKLGDHLQAENPELYEPDRSWHVRVTEKSSGKECGRLRIDGWTGEVKWRPTETEEVPLEKEINRTASRSPAEQPLAGGD